MHRDDAVCEHGVVKSWRRQYDVITAPVPRAVVCHVTLQSLAVVDKLRELLIRNEFVEERLRSYHLGDLTTVSHVHAHHHRQRPQYV